jgi:hypothetical protein
MGLIIGRSPACDNPRPNARRLEIDVALIDEDQHAQDGDIEAEGGFLSMQVADCHMANHSPATTMKPKNQTRKARRQAAMM